MYVNVVMKLPLGRQLVVPASAVFHSGTRQVVFVNHGQGRFEPREVQTGLQAGEQVVITKGVKDGESIATSANFLIDSESQLQAAAGSYVPPLPGAGGAAAMNAVAVNVSLTSEPTPPRKGSNLFRVNLTNEKGVPVTGAQVTVTLFMAAMPAMGMSEMRVAVHCSDKGGGLYEGRGELGSGGTWQVTVTAQQNGRTVATKQLRVNATGGM
jgi:Cu(I)/Ag(I) efflux system membrane fusion protein/cobalt-zinc-cadmium efflux system membrane fusion protein